MSETTTPGSREGQLVLALDTSTASLAAALVRGDEVLRDIQSLAERNHSVHTVSVVKELLSECGIAPEELAGIAIGRGPGSYTGMRIAVSVGKTLAWVWQKPLVGVSSLEALAYGAWQTGTDNASSVTANRPVWIVPIMDARRGQVYTGAFEASAADASTSSFPAAWKRLAKDGIRQMHDWVDRLDADVKEMDAASRPAAIWIVGELQLHEAEAERLRNLCPEVEVAAFPYILEGRSVAALGLSRLAAGESDDVHTFIPNYTQLTEAEVKLQERTASQQQNAVEGAGKHDGH
ncbi:tRNA (adenosine(37)-N6)-threonylcarbamoyltransferase complex dimerization subunit type 1 TsaB [Paenibacillus lignilyticus]|uniref:tRNA (Adenosine(37)-N6)-threonylcarbamoyltransferase complex dimerization subunit type 1 TsaB n=1 Tax=Paenibacillus lignilyticus TaxID=1172615 RepID=A0ABS5CIE3_9BACL|nr:tRNA (adenosine(37)-N6)-threonylcarbamoyltransferase complex dimerization subunit type 1 TsaB [Paenibacillus lignilyticus]MBP3965630.1 tRNA (adenosine(37)-N6)-threonylcarbamoyltransferase complex dimerization subunit type 1 TsaB [Paenibacillus lignilyticus]